MPSKQDKINAITALQSVAWDAQQLELSLRFAKQPDKADEVWEKNQRLSTEIDILIGQAVDRWNAQSDTVIADLQQSDSDLTAAMKNIKDAVAVATNISKAIGLIDDVLALAVKLATII